MNSIAASLGGKRPSKRKSESQTEIAFTLNGNLLRGTLTFLLLVTESINGKCEARGEKRGQGREEVMMEDARPRVKIEAREE